MQASTKICMGITGAMLVALGIICILNPGATILSASIVMGILICVSGISTIATWSRMRAFMPSGSLLLSGILEVILGIIFLYNNVIVAAALPFVFACWMLIEGIILSIRSFDFKQINFTYWWVILLIGIFSAVIGFISLRYPFDVAAPVFSYLIGAGIILLGAAEIAVLVEINKIEKCTYRWINGAEEQ